MSFYSSLKAAALAAVLALPIPANAQCATAAGADEGPAEYLFILGTSEMPVVGAAMHLALSALDSGRVVHILLMANGLDLAREGMTGTAFAPYGLDGPAMLDRAIKAGADVQICQICLKNQNLTMAMMIEGVGKTNAYDVLDLMEKADVVLPFGSVGDALNMGDLTAPEASQEPQEGACDPATDPDECM